MQRIGNFASEIALDRENVGHIAIVIVGPDVLIGVGIDQLHVHAHPVSRSADASLKNIGNTKRLADFAKVRRPASVLHHRCARNHPEIAYLRQVGKHVVLHAVGEIGVFFFIAQIFKWQDGD